MQSQHELPGSDASAKAQTRSGILTPASDNSLNLSDSVPSGSRKRKRDVNSGADLLKDSFVVKPYPPAGIVKPRTLHPLVLLPRAHLPLASLDFNTSANTLPRSRLFEAHVKILELEARMGNQPVVLIARLDDGRTLYAVEREDRDLFVLCKLGSWVDLQQLRKAAVVSRQELPGCLEEHNAPLQHNVPAILETPESSKYTKKKRLAIEAIQSMVKRPSTGLLTESQPVTPVALDPEPPPNSQPTENVTEPPQLGEPSAPTADEIFDTLRLQYLEALYLSKASLAYFAKGPLSRARAAFHLDLDSTLDMNDHIAFLETLTLSTSVIDKKYRDSLPECVSLIDIEDHSADDGKDSAIKPKKRKTSKKMKPGKNGLYPTEDTLIRRWWSSHDDDAGSGAPGSSKEARVKSRIAELRIRETQLQIIVILEALALQPLATRPETVEAGLPSALPMGISDDKEKPKSKKPDQLLTLIDLHIDRLCIWQSIQVESAKVNSGDSQKVPVAVANSATSTRNMDNILRDFCVEVIAPFFSARLPDRCASINRKLGGPVAISPPKPKLSKASGSTGPSRPGAATKRPIPVKPRRSLQRVLSDERERNRSVSRGPERAISLMRSATMPTVPGLKREASEAPSLSSIPFADSQNVAANRGGILNSKKFSRREVDLGSLVPDPKTKKKASIEAELKEAISALKKPNRELAGKTLVETAERRTASASSAKKMKKPTRNPLFQGVQISATPKANRSTNVLAKSQPGMLSGYDEEPEFMALPSSSISMVPQSVSRPSRDGLQPVNPFISSVQATPSRRSSISNSSKFVTGVSHVEQTSFPPSSPFDARRTSAPLFAAVPDSVVKKEPDFPRAFQDLQETPVKRRPGKVQHGHPEPTSDGNKENKHRIKGVQQEESIYKTLGWDDDFDELA